ncbi:alcohol dehydrogenase [Fusarium proliferatum]|nr:alcohol dehydrogenase [Fusarium proliferatum]
MSFGDKNWQPWLLDKDEALPVLKYAFDKGINMWDFADTYSNGESERILGAAIKHYNIPRSKLVIMSKCFQFVDEEKGPIDPATLTSNNGPRVNRDRHDVPPKEIMKALNDVIESGKVRYIGASSMAAWEFQMLQNAAEKNGSHEFISMQGLYNLLCREEEREMNPYCNYTGVAVVDRVEELAQKKGVAMAQIAQSWLIAKGCMPICGLESEERIDQAVGALQVKLSDEETKHLEELYVPKMSFPF